VASASGGMGAAKNGTGVVSPSPSAFTGAGNALAWSSGMAVAGLAAVAGLIVL